MNLHLVLVEPAGPLNVGSVARLCANYGLAGLRLVAPRCDPQAEEARRMAVHGLPLLEQARVYPTLAAAVADCRRVVATSGRGEGEPLPPQGPAAALGWLQASPGDTALVFGREDRGLSNEELLLAGRLLRLDTGSSYASLNLSHAVAIALHERQRLLAAPPVPAPAGTATTSAALQGLLADARDLLLDTGFLLPHTAAARMAKVAALLQRAEVSDGEVALLRGMVCQLRWASRHPAATSDGP
ncbi:MAG: TrmJ/YjtD family RNA methyltransferase [Cyanobacteriota bacterium]|nr:TrmJ/YjtD family RNA methyltransferase [Cyanobacteriota bacterium]